MLYTALPRLPILNSSPLLSIACWPPSAQLSTRRCQGTPCCTAAAPAPPTPTCAYHIPPESSSPCFCHLAMNCAHPAGRALLPTTADLMPPHMSVPTISPTQPTQLTSIPLSAHVPSCPSPSRPSLHLSCVHSPHPSPLPLLCTVFHLLLFTLVTTPLKPPPSTLSIPHSACRTPTLQGLVFGVEQLNPSRLSVLTPIHPLPHTSHLTWRQQSLCWVPIGPKPKVCCAVRPQDVNLRPASCQKHRAPRMQVCALRCGEMQRGRLAQPSEPPGSFRQPLTPHVPL